MNSYVIIPLIATIAYIPLFVILLLNRPWNRKQKLFFLFLIPAMLWSLSDIFFRSYWFMPAKLLLVKVGICLVIWMVVQFHYFLRSFYRPERIKIPWAYVFLASAIALAVLGYTPRSIEVIASGINVDYGTWILILGFLILAILGTKNVYSLVRKYRISSEPAEQNSIIYLLAATAILIIFLFSSFAPGGGKYPLGHIGNLLTASILTYAVITHHLLDIRVALRRSLMYVGIYGSGIVLFIILFLLAHLVFHFEIDRAPLVAFIAIGIPIIVLFVHRVRPAWQERVEKSFVGEKYNYRKQLFDFTTKIQSVSTLEQFGSELTSLLAKSVDCGRACLLLPETENGDFDARFIYPTVEANPMQNLRLRRDSPIVTWLKREDAPLMQRSLSILPEFQSIWQEEEENIQSAKVEMFIPLIDRGELVAVLALSDKQHGKSYTVEDIDLLRAVASRVAATMEKEYYHEQLREQDRELTLANRLSATVTSSISIEEIFDGFANALKEIIPLDYATIALIEEDWLRTLALFSQVELLMQPGQLIPLKGTTTEWVMGHKKSLYEADLARQKRFPSAEQYIKMGIRSIIHLPLIVKDEVIGSLILASRQPNAYSPRQIRLLEQVASQIATPVENSRLYAKAEQRSRIDELTGLFNRRHFEERLKEEIARHSRHGDVFSLFLLDLDNFKAYNDIYGHPSGDKLLTQIGRIIRNSIRSADQAFRYGGDEFVVILPQTSVDDAYIVAERVRRQLVAEMEAEDIAVTCSIGLASYPSDGVMFGELVTTADTALYYAKHTGGNRVYLPSKVLSEPATETGTHARGSGLSVVYALAAAVDAKDSHTYGHSRKVNAYAVALAEAIGLSPDEVSKISTAAVLHDIGKIGISDKILSKKGKLSHEDWEAIRFHPRLGANIVGNVPNLVPCVGAILHHHERWDGTGYPEGLKGKNIPLEARILAIADAYEAMTSARPYRGALCEKKAVEELERGAGTQFDPELVKVFIGLVEAGFLEKMKVGQDQLGHQANP